MRRYRKLLACCLLQTCALAMQPPDHNDKTYETLQDYRKRLNIDFGYHTKHLNPELCRTLTEEECQKLDETFGERVKRNQQFLTPDRRRKLQGSPTTLNVLVLLVLWPEHEAISRPLPAVADIETLFNAQDIDGVINRAGSISRYFQRNSYGQMDIRATVIDWTEADNTELFYSNPDMGRTQALAPAFTNSLERAESQGVDFSEFDQDGDGFLDLTVVMHSGFDGVEGGDDCDTGATPSQRIASHALVGPPDTSDWLGQGIFRLGGYSVASVFRQVCDLQLARLNIVTHEMFHPLGLPDLYDIEGPLNPEFGRVGGIGGFDIMANPNGQMDRPAFPGYLSAWSKFFLGWVNPIEITSDGTYQARATQNFPDIYRISPAGCDAREYFLIENRQPIPEDFDERFWPPGGITIYHIDENNFNVAGNGNSPRGGTFLPGWPFVNGQLHYPVALMQRDGAYEMEQAINDGHIEDVYTSPDQEVAPGSGANFPNTDCYAFGNIISTGITINNFQSVPGTDPTTMTFDVVGLQAGNPTDAPTRESTREPTTSPTRNPTAMPSPVPTSQPETAPPTETPGTALPTESPSDTETMIPTRTSAPSDAGSDISSPSFSPTTVVSTVIPTTMNPTMGEFTLIPTINNMTLIPTIPAPSGTQTIPEPSGTPTDAPVAPILPRISRPSTNRNVHTGPTVPEIIRPTRGGNPHQPTSTRPRPTRPSPPRPARPYGAQGKGKGNRQNSKAMHKQLRKNKKTRKQLYGFKQTSIEHISWKGKELQFPTRGNGGKGGKGRKLKKIVKGTQKSGN